MTDGTVVSFDVAPYVVEVRMTRPEKRNALTLESLAAAIDAAAARSEVRVILLTGAGRSFCAGVGDRGGAGARHDRRPAPRAVLRPRRRGGGRGVPAIRAPRPHPGSDEPQPVATARDRAGRDMLLTSRPMTGAEVHALGFVQRVAPADRLAEAALVVAGEIGANSPCAVPFIKDMRNSG